MSTDTPPAAQPPRLRVVCLCADWCGTCRDYAAPFAELARSHPDCRFDWLDIEDHADLLGDLDVENFPTVLLAADGKPVFYGTLLPHIQTLERLLLQAPGLRPLLDKAEAAALGELLLALDSHPPGSAQ